MPQRCIPNKTFKIGTLRDAYLQIEVLDYRQKIIGSYFGQRVDVRWTGSGSNFTYDTLATTLLVSLTQGDSTVALDFSPDYSFEDINFMFQNDSLISVERYHPPLITLFKDSLLYEHSPSLGPDHTKVMVSKP